MMFEATVSLIVRVDHYIPARPAPVCFNPSSPAYSDPGDDEEIDFTLFIKNEKNELVEITDSAIYDAVADEVFDAIRGEYGLDYN